MNDVKLRLNYLLSLEVKVVNGDECSDGGGAFIVNREKQMNIPNKHDNAIFVESFAARVNTGVQPVVDGVPVVVNLSGFGYSEGFTCEFTWRLDNEHGDIQTWKPDLDALIKMQIEYDKKQTGEDTVKKLTSDQIKWEDGMNWAVVCKKDNNAIRDQYAGQFTKRINKYNDVLICFGSYRYSAERFYLIKRKSNKKIVDAVNFFRGEYPAKHSCNLEPVILEDKLGLLYSGGKNHVKSMFDVVCTIEQFNQCVANLTGGPKEHLAWLTALNDMREEEEKEKEIIDTMANQMAINLINNAEKTVEWKCGLPPAGVECMVFNAALHNPKWEKCTILFMGKYKVVYDSESCSERVGLIDIIGNMEFKPIETQQQKADLEREEMAKALFDLYIKSRVLCGGISSSWENTAEHIKAPYKLMIDAGVTIKG